MKCGAVLSLTSSAARTVRPCVIFWGSDQVKIFKNESGKTEVWVQSELRVGQSDLGVNLNRMKAFLGHLGMKLS